MNNLLPFPDRNPRPWMSLLQDMGAIPAGLHHLERRGAPRFAGRLLERLDHMSTRFAHAPAAPAHPGPVPVSTTVGAGLTHSRPDHSGPVHSGPDHSSPARQHASARHHFLTPASAPPVQPDVTRWLQTIADNQKNSPTRAPGMPEAAIGKDPPKDPSGTIDLSGISLLRPRRH
jgi:hypothetical protein